MLTNLAATHAVLSPLAGGAELQTQEVQGMAIMLLMFACLAGAAFPDGAWRRAVVLGLSVPLAHWLSHATGRALPYPMPDLATASLALIPAFVGTWLGVSLRRVRSMHAAKQPRA